ncbi:hypothetical protein MIC97_24185 [Aquamicrobium sp. NLF2-7]|uniref:I78 family peptidase inhibitor n=1 Tax=Aquamicrobium sp. NLF2-7 TaxID=2918753 RepID=UPI001EFAE341|nr:I78 family peptidase inhibitor [Aquamicrobium sp. NLF2-7]MCG8274554.1 hypothetical protein [Aquamicrobium sp. NLF2-7]MCG8274585.1 hypothetical protein [Aquamicrobium sp. NLF2-7]
MRHEPKKSATLTIAAAALAALLALAGCTTGGTAQAPASGVCDQAATERLAGHAKMTDAEAMRLTGASIVRQIAPGQPVQQDYTDARVTIETSPATGRVVRAYCG